MNYLFLIPISISLGGQYEDLEGAAARVLLPNATPISPRDKSEN